VRQDLGGSGAPRGVLDLRHAWCSSGSQWVDRCVVVKVQHTPP
jgi:hypothetical protein